jgi:hypothetical protein
MTEKKPTRPWPWVFDCSTPAPADCPVRYLSAEEIAECAKTYLPPLTKEERYVKYVGNLLSMRSL